MVTTDGKVLGEALATQVAPTRCSVKYAPDGLPKTKSVLCTQADIHAVYGGVVPNLAMEAHKAAMDSCVDTAVRQAGITLQDLDAVAVSIGPGLSPCLHVSSHHARHAVTDGYTLRPSACAQLYRLRDHALAQHVVAYSDLFSARSALSVSTWASLPH